MINISLIYHITSYIDAKSRRLLSVCFLFLFSEKIATVKDEELTEISRIGNYEVMWLKIKAITKQLDIFFKHYPFTISITRSTQLSIASTDTYSKRE